MRRNRSPPRPFLLLLSCLISPDMKAQFNAAQSSETCERTLSGYFLTQRNERRQQNLGTQGPGPGYLGQLKSLIPELIEDVEILNGPFTARTATFPDSELCRS